MASGGAIAAWSETEQWSNPISGVVVSAELSHEMAISDGDYILLNGVPSEVGAILEPGERVGGAERSLIIPVAPSEESLSVCWIRVERQATEIARSLVQAVVADIESARVTSVRDRDTLAQPIGMTLPNRQTRRIWLVGLAILSIFWWVDYVAQRSRFSVYSVSGISRAEHWLMRFFEVAIASMIGFASGVAFMMAVLLVVEPLALDNIELAFGQVLLATLGTMLFGPVSSLFLSNNIAQLLKAS
jgi:hypothetical protein